MATLPASILSFAGDGIASGYSRTTNAANNDNSTGATNPAALTVAFTAIPTLSSGVYLGTVDVVFQCAPSGDGLSTNPSGLGDTEYFWTLTVKNNTTGQDINQLDAVLGYGTGASFVQSDEVDQVDWDTTGILGGGSSDPTRTENSGFTTITLVNSNLLRYSGGTGIVVSSSGVFGTGQDMVDPGYPGTTGLPSQANVSSGFFDLTLRFIAQSASAPPLVGTSTSDLLLPRSSRMPYAVRNLPSMVPTSSGSTVTAGVGSLDDADSLTIFFVSTANALSTLWAVQVSQFDPAIPLPAGVVQSTAWFQLSSAPVVQSSGTALRISPVAFRGIRLSGASSSLGADTVAFVSKQILV